MYEPVPLRPYHRDWNRPVLYNKVTPYITTIEQDDLITNILKVASSDSRFAEKALAAIKSILDGGINAGVVPTILSLMPNQKGMGSQNFQVRVRGAGFDNTCVIYVNGNVVPTTFVSNVELTTNLDLTSVTSPTIYPIVVKNSLGVLSNSVNFTVTSGLTMSEVKDARVSGDKTLEQEEMQRKEKEESHTGDKVVPKSDEENKDKIKKETVHLGKNELNKEELVKGFDPEKRKQEGGERSEPPPAVKQHEFKDKN